LGVDLAEAMVKAHHKGKGIKGPPAGPRQVLGPYGRA
jgi:hypothetical protein